MKSFQEFLNESNNTYYVYDKSNKVEKIKAPSMETALSSAEKQMGIHRSKLTIIDSKDLNKVKKSLDKYIIDQIEK